MSKNNPLLLNKNNLIHIIGIGGLAMSAIAKLLAHHGYQVQGSDQLTVDIPPLKTFKGHHPHNIQNVDLVIRSTAISDDNVEILAAQQLSIPIISRKEILAELIKHKHTVAITGTHGKTTTTSMLGTILDVAQYDPTIISGGIMNLYNDNLRIGDGNWHIVEADESDGTFLALPKSMAVVTNIEADHLDYYHSYENLISHFQRFIATVPFHGCTIICQDYVNMMKLSPSSNLITYGLFNQEVDLQLHNIRQNGQKTSFDVITSAKLNNLNIPNITINIPGVHNAYNAGGAICSAIKLGVQPAQIVAGLEKYIGVQKRFTKVGQFKGADVIEDYAHHPTSIIATIKTAQKLCTSRNKVIAVIQPHRYSRLRDFFPDYVDISNYCQHLILLDVYAAGEEKIDGIDSKKLCKAMQQMTQGYIKYLDNHDDLPETLDKITNKRDIVLFMLAGKCESISKIIDG